jgi:1-acyl-sn-glycerol-3-phosphate acyltransferase
VSNFVSSFGQTIADLGGALLPFSTLEFARELDRRLNRVSLQLNDYGYDPYGFHPDAARRLMLPAAFLYRYYFRAEVYDIDHVPEGRVLLIANHAGQMPYDGMMLAMAMLVEPEPPRLCRGMGEYFIWRLPWLGVQAARGGTLVGTVRNCVSMLEGEECVMVFPEGARGINKPFTQRYQLERFGLGFMRLALETDTPIVPVAIVGSEEQQPGLANLTGPAEFLGLPSLPITVTFPLLGPLGLLVALPVKYHIYFGESLRFEGHPGDEDAVIQKKVDVVRQSITDLFARGRSERTGIFR